MRLTKDDILGLTVSVLAQRYDDPKPVPSCHEEWWELFCSDHPQVAISAPRGHAKSTSVTFAFSIGLIGFRAGKHILLLGASEEMASLFIQDIRTEFQENEELIRAFSFKKFLKQTETELIGQFTDGEKFRMIAKGAMQRMRGLKWERKRPDWVLFDDLEDDEIVLNEQRREKFRRWFYGAVRPIVKSGGKIRGVGTIIHLDSLLNRMMPPKKDIDTVDLGLKVYSKKPRGWQSVKYRAHTPDFQQILWPQMYDEARLKAIRADFAEMGMLDVYGQEYLNEPIDESTSKFRRQDFLPMEESHKAQRMRYYVGADLAIGEKKRNARTVFVVGGMDEGGFLNIVDVRKDRWDGPDIVDEMFNLDKRYSPEIFRVEQENIQRALGGFIYNEMDTRRQYINLDTKPPTKDKDQRATALASMMRAGRVRFDKQADWYPDFEDELCSFPRGTFVDQVDAAAWLGDLIQNLEPAQTSEEIEQEAYDLELEESFALGRSAITGY